MTNVLPLQGTKGNLCSAALVPVSTSPPAVTNKLKTSDGWKLQGHSRLNSSIACEQIQVQLSRYVEDRLPGGLKPQNYTHMFRPELAVTYAGISLP